MRSRPTPLEDEPDFERLRDSELLALCREGDPDAFAELYVRHHRTAIRTARRTSSRLDAEDVAAEAFARVWNAIRGGGGPSDAFRPYLVSTVRNVALNLGTRSREVPSDPESMNEVADDTGLQPDDVVVGIVEARRVTAAFAALPERWRSVLWMTEVEGRGIDEVARRLGLSNNSASALAMRARDGLRTAWLQRHLADEEGDAECRWVSSRLAAFTRHRLSTAQHERVAAHLAGCRSCDRSRGQLAYICSSIRVVSVVAGAGATIWATTRAAGTAAAAPGTPAGATALGRAAQIAHHARHAATAKLAGAPMAAVALVAASGLGLGLAPAPVSEAAGSVTFASTPAPSPVRRTAVLPTPSVPAPSTPTPTATPTVTPTGSGRGGTATRPGSATTPSRPTTAAPKPKRTHQNPDSGEPRHRPKRRCWTYRDALGNVIRICIGKA